MIFSAHALFVAVATILAGLSPASSDSSDSIGANAAPVRVTPVNMSRPALLSIRDWKEKDAPKCIMLNALAGMAVNQRDSIDMVMRGGKVYRAKLKKGCAAIDYYSGLYVNPSSDGRLCEDRDKIFSRTGGMCQVAKFKSLAPPK
jgi:hypothetical protein